MKAPIRILAVSLMATLLLDPAVASEGGVFGFSPERSDEQLALETRYEELLRAENLRDWMQRMTVRVWSCSAVTTLNPLP